MNGVFNEKVYEDNKGYLRFRDSHKLVHRWVAFKELYSKNKEKYPFAFDQYLIHHIDSNKRNNRPENLKLLTKYEHETIHGYERFEWDIIRILVVLLIFASISPLYIAILKEYAPSNLLKAIGIIAYLLIIFCVVKFVCRDKKNVKRVY